MKHHIHGIENRLKKLSKRKQKCIELEIIEAGMKVIESIVEFCKLFEEFDILFGCEKGSELIIKITDACEYDFSIFF